MLGVIDGALMIDLSGVLTRIYEAFYGGMIFPTSRDTEELGDDRLRLSEKAEETKDANAK